LRLTCGLSTRRRYRAAWLDGRLSSTARLVRARSLGARLLARFLAVEGAQAATLLAAQAFTSLVPMLVVVAALSPASGDLGDRLVDRFGLHGAAAEQMHALFNGAGDVSGAVAWVGLAILLVSALSFTRALQRVFERAYAIRVGRREAVIRGFVWLAGFAVWVALLAPLHDQLADAGGLGLTAVVVGVSGFVLWLATPVVLLGRRHWRRLAWGAAVSATIGAVIGVASGIWLPLALNWSARRYGLIGVAFTLQTVLLLEAGAIVAGAVAGATLSEAEGQPREV
jgi:membrane protein